MRPFTSTVPFDEALRRLRAAAVPVGRVERVRLSQAAGRVLGHDLVADHDVPGFDRAAMDGYAVVAADTVTASPASPVALREVGVAYTGDVPGARLERGACLEIATGAPVPPGADAVVMVEQTEPDAAGRVIVRATVEPGQNVGPRGSDIRAGDLVLRSGDELTPGRLGAAAALGLAEVDVFARPLVVIASTGNEVVEPGRPLAPGQVHDVNTTTLHAIVRDHGGEPIVHAPVRDTLGDLRRALDAAVDADLVILSGGSSVGERDLLVDVLRECGEVIFHGIAVKPGKPTLLGRVGRQLLLGMPGNPTSCLSNGYILLVPLLRVMARLPPWRPEVRRLRLASPVTSTSDRHQFYPVRVERDEAVPVFKGSGDITSLAHADGYFEIPVGVGLVEAGTPVDVILF